MYFRTTNCKKVNEYRTELFVKHGRTMERIPPTLAALNNHIKMVAFQAGHVWGQSLESCPLLPSPYDWGWKLNEMGRYVPD